MKVHSVKRELVKEGINMKRVAIGFGIALVVSISAFAVTQRITSFSGTAQGQGTLTVGHEKSKIKSVYINLKENGEADITIFTDLQLLAKGQWSAPADASKGIPLKITGGIVDGSAIGSGTLFLSADGKSPSKLNIQAKGAGSRKVIVEFVADRENRSQ